MRPSPLCAAATQRRFNRAGLGTRTETSINGFAKYYRQRTLSGVHEPAHATVRRNRLGRYRTSTSAHATSPTGNMPASRKQRLDFNAESSLGLQEQFHHRRPVIWPRWSYTARGGNQLPRDIGWATSAEMTPKLLLQAGHNGCRSITTPWISCTSAIPYPWVTAVRP